MLFTKSQWTATAGVLLAVGCSTLVSALSVARQDSSFYLDYPACDYYRCIVNWTSGSDVFINWVGAPYGTIQLSFMTDNNNAVAYEIANVSSPSQPGYCDAGEGVGVVIPDKPCGRFAFTVPSEWTTGTKNYSVRAQLIGDEENYVSYTDVVRIEAAADGAASVALSTVTISGAPTSTDGSGSVGFTGTYTAPTSPGASASSSSSSSQATSTSGGSALTAASSSASSATASSASSAAASTTASTSDGSSLMAASSVIAGIVAFVALGMAVVI